jgi:hypothetical protein
LLDDDPLDLIEADLVTLAIVELRRARRHMICHRACLFECAGVLRIGGDPGRPKAVVARLGANPGVERRREET